MENNISSSKFTMASCAKSSSGTTGSKKRLPEELTELLDVAIYTFACQAGLRAGHKVRGNPVLKGMSAFFGQLIETANEEGYEEAAEGHLPWKIGRMATRRGAIASTLNVGVLANKANEIETINKGRR